MTRSRRRGSLRLKEREQLRVDLILERGAHPVRRSRNYFQYRSFDKFGLQQGRIGVRYDLIVVALHDERRDIELREVFGLIGFGEGLDAIVDSLNPTLHPGKPK